MIPQNLLGIALSIIGKQAFQYVRFVTREVNAIGNDVAVYAQPVKMTGSVQAVPRNLYQKYGLDFQKDYKVFYVSKDVADIMRNSSGDKFYYVNEVYQTLSNTDWFPMNGWMGIMCVHVPGGFGDEDGLC